MGSRPPLREPGVPSGWRGYRWVTLWSVPIAAVPVADRFLPPAIHLAHLLVIPLALAAAFADTRRTAVTALLASGALVVAGAERRALTTENVLVQMLSMVLFSALLVGDGAGHRALKGRGRGAGRPGRAAATRCALLTGGSPSGREGRGLAPRDPAPPPGQLGKARFRRGRRRASTPTNSCV